MKVGSWKLDQLRGSSLVGSAWTGTVVAITLYLVVRGSLRLSGTDIYVMICQYYAAGDCAPTACRRAP